MNATSIRRSTSAVAVASSTGMIAQLRVQRAPTRGGELGDRARGQVG